MVKQVSVKYDSRNGIHEFSANGSKMYLGPKSLVELSEKSFDEFPEAVISRGGGGLKNSELENMYNAIQDTVANSPEILEEIR